MHERSRLLRLGGSLGAGPGMWGLAVSTQWERVARAAEDVLLPADNGAEVRRRHDVLGFECHFLLISVHNVRVYADAIFVRTQDSRIQERLAHFDAVVPSSRALRNVVTHL